MLELMTLTPQASRLVDAFTSTYLGIGRVASWSDGVPILWRCSCGQPALVITEQLVGLGQVKSLMCLRKCRGRVLRLSTEQCRWIEEVQAAELATTSRLVSMPTVYSPIPIL